MIKNFPKHLIPLLLAILLNCFISVVHLYSWYNMDELSYLKLFNALTNGLVATFLIFVLRHAYKQHEKHQLDKMKQVLRGK